MMADNVHRKSHKTSDGRKLSMPINRTTSETIRIATNNGDNDNKNSSSGQSGLSQNCMTPIGNSTSTPNNNQCKKKTSSFQITSVTVGNRLSNDAGEDSNDDLDESHGEDNSIEHSRIENDIETPSYSEDTFSKDDVFFNASNSGLSTAPVIPTSSQYGLAIVPSDASGNVSNSSNDSNINSLDITNVNENNIINLLSSNNKQDNDDTTRDCVTQTRNERFKVVKIESTEPFKRGRWTCMDYLDHTSVNNQANNIKTIDPNQVCISYGVSDGVMLPSNVNDDKLIGDLNGHVTNQNYPSNSIQQQNCQRNLPAAGIQQLQPIYFHSTAQQQQQQQLQQQGSTLPSNLQPMHSNNLGQAQSMPQGSIPIITHTNNNNLGANMQEDYVNLGTQGGLCQNLCQGVNNPPIIIQNQGLQVGQQGQINQINDNLSGIQRIQGIQSLHQVQQGGIHGVNQSTLSNNCVIGGAGGGNVGAGVNAQVQIVPQVGGCQGIGGMGFHQEGTEQDSVTGAAADAALLECLAEVTQTNDDHQQLGDNESMSGTSAVAIDNKIEQAMDLVKSHLMFAVREEVEVLKEKIAELMDRINQLEAENSILKAHATPEILAQLNQVINKIPQNNLASGQ